MNHDRNTCVR